ncbi:MAG: hypothetical protein EOP84_23865 [Verrucomicrobiaceae bacterium]|nr:MAG: hypothetical protein EOP84_23865 [Verrucomicrobiaceae bacterium]
MKGNREIEVEASASSLAELWVLLEGEFVLDIDINVENEGGPVFRVEMHPHDEAVKVTVCHSVAGEQINSKLAACFPDHREFVGEKEFLTHYAYSSGINYAELMELKQLGILGDQA